MRRVLLVLASAVFAATFVGGAAFVGEREAEAQTAPAKKNGRIYFSSDRETPANPQGDREIFSMDPDGSGLRQLTYNSVDDDEPVVSPDGERIAYRDANGVAYTMSAAGGNPTRLSSGTSLSFSPDSRQVAFDAYDIYVIPAVGGRFVRLTQNASGDDPAFSPDGRRIAYAAKYDAGYFGREIYTVPTTGGAPTRLTNNGLADDCPVFSPDGRRIFYRNGHEGDIFADTGPKPVYDVFSIPASGGRPPA